MRRTDKELFAHSELEAVLRSGKVCHLAIAAEPAPYVLPLNYGYTDGALYFHSAHQGRKLDLMRKNSAVSFAVTIDLGIVKGEQACDWGAKFRCVLGSGRIEILETLEEKRQGLDLLMAQYAEGEFSYPDSAVDNTCVYRLVIESMSGKQAGI